VTESSHPDRSVELAALVGQGARGVEVAPEAVNRTMIRHWVEAMGDENLVYASDEGARAAGLAGVVAPPTMLQAWTMRGLKATLAVQAARRAGTGPKDQPFELMMALLEEEGRTSVVATDCEQDYLRPLVPGERVVVAEVIEDITAEKVTGLGAGRFVTLRTDYSAVPDEAVTEGSVAARLAETGEPVGSMRFRIFKFRPPDRLATEPPARPPRPRPAVTADNAFFYEGTKKGQLLIQRCTACGRLRHPPSPACAACRSFDWDTVEASGRGELYSFVVVHHPQVPAFDYPLPIALVALEEGTRIVANVEGIGPADLRIGMPVQARIAQVGDDLFLPVFGPVTGSG
jgi:uncharacterized OB-fold protein